MAGFFGPGHFRDMDQTFNALFNLHKNSVICDTYNLADRLGTHRIPFGNRGPWIRTQLLDAQGNPVGIFVVLENFYFNLIAYLIELGRMGYPAP